MPFLRLNGRHVLFIHIPKTGGGAIDKWMKQYGDLRLYSIGMSSFSVVTPQHYTYSNIRFLLGDDFFDYKCAVVRNPYTRLESEYRMQYLLGKQGFWNAFQTFSLWLEHVQSALHNSAFTNDNHLRPQIDFIGSGVEVFKYEDGLDRVITRLRSELGVGDEHGLERVHKSDDFDGKIVWDAQDRILVNRLYAEDFERFGYETITDG